MFRRFISCFVVASIAAMVFAVPVSAAQRALTKQSCEAAQGTFTSDRGVKYCTHLVTTYVVEGAWQANQALVPVTEWSAFRYTAGFRYDTTYEQVVVQSQIGNRDVLTTTENVVVGQTLVLGGCSKVLIDPLLGIVLQIEDEWNDLPRSECEALGLYPTT